MHFLTVEGIVERWSVASCDHETNAGIVHPHKSLVKQLTVIFEQVVHSWASQAHNSTYHVYEQRD